MGTRQWASLLLFVAVTACAQHHSPTPGRGNSGCEEDPSAPGCGGGGAAATAGRSTGGAGRASAASGGSGNITGGAGSIAPTAGRGPTGQGATGAAASGAVVGSSTCASPFGRIGNGPPSNGGELDHALFFSPLYSGYDGVHTFRVPITVRGYLDIEWETDRPDLVDLEKVNDNTAMITTRGAGTARIIAHAGSQRGTAVLTITRFEPEEWARGQSLYASGVIMVPQRGFMLPADLSCRGCHGGAADALSVEYTPQQTGGYSDEELTAIVTRGATPPRANWSTAVPLPIYKELHTWPGASAADARPLVAYLRSLAPMTACK